MFVAVASTGGHIMATPRQQPSAYAIAARPMPYQPPSSVQNGLPAPLMTPRDPGIAGMYYPH
eukprot:2827347-Rhodomonas_salina.1